MDVLFSSTFDFLDDSTDTNGATSSKAERVAKLKQSEGAFLAQKSSWSPVCQTKQASRRLEYAKMPADAAAAVPASKEELLEIKAAAEERYYSRHFDVALVLAERALLAGEELIHSNEKRELLVLQERCKTRLGKPQT